MREYLKHYIDGHWVDPITPSFLELENPATEEVSGRIVLGSGADVDLAVAAARRAFPAWSATSREHRLDILAAILSEYEKRSGDLARATTDEMGAPAALASGFQIGLGHGHLTTAIEVLKTFPFEEQRGETLITRIPIGVCGLITPWNWPMNQVAVKVFPALATGCTVVLKPSELSSFSAAILAEILEAAGVPAGVFNLVFGDGPDVGAAMAAHPDIDMISFTGSTRAGVEIARTAAATVKRVTQELGGKSASIILDDADLAQNVASGVHGMMGNSGQTCSAPSRMLVPAARLEEAISIARDAAAEVTVGDPNGNFTIGPVVSKAQFDKIQTLIRQGEAEGATVVAGGSGRPDGLEKGYYVRPTVFADVTMDMAIAREEIFGPVLTMLSYSDLDHAIAIANESDYGLAGYVSGKDPAQTREVARRIKAGWVVINGAFDFNAPFGGVGRSGNGREWGEFGFHEYVEVKAILGHAPA
ncbi:aldehyde dehydrogenase family protein [Brevundimonas sp.]|uniref:aldehyde dehydrogenase family protein n=1 Tax=Brevundimonas sp. TaxID=1871086 RepID=UPI003BABBD74